MFGSQMLEVAIGLAIVYLLLSLTCSAFTELISNLLALRARNLEEGIRRMLNDGGDAQRAAKLYKLPLIKSLAQGWNAKKPNYIPSRTFALALLDTLVPADTKVGAKSFRDVRATVATLPEGSMKKTLLLYLDEAQGDLQKARQNIEAWFNDTMERVSDWYKRQAQIIILAFSLLLCAAVNVDTITLANSFYRDPTLRNAVVAAAERSLEESAIAESDTPITQAIALRNELQVLELPLGWTAPNLEMVDPREAPVTAQGWLQKLVGVLLTTFAVSLGAPFWFDMLKKLVSLRAPAKTDEAEPIATAPVAINVTSGAGIGAAPSAGVAAAPPSSPKP